MLPLFYIVAFLIIIFLLVKIVPYLIIGVIVLIGAYLIYKLKG